MAQKTENSTTKTVSLIDILFLIQKISSGKQPSFGRMFNFSFIFKHKKRKVCFGKIVNFKRNLDRVSCFGRIHIFKYSFIIKGIYFHDKPSRNDTGNHNDEVFNKKEVLIQEKLKMLSNETLNIRSSMKSRGSNTSIVTHMDKCTKFYMDPTITKKNVSIRTDVIRNYLFLVKKLVHPNLVKKVLYLNLVNIFEGNLKYEILKNQNQNVLTQKLAEAASVKPKFFWGHLSFPALGIVQKARGFLVIHKTRGFICFLKTFTNFKLRMNSKMYNYDDN